jgi:antitoxin HicB
MIRKYHVTFTPDDNDTLLVTCPALPDVANDGDDVADALAHSRDSVETALADSLGWRPG